ncbi:hypothetical protein N7532_008330 [Penicillium argentinense]|uniref:Uncharacterized protein n=1 Tax=Penicillium argentinense TaxID=1131581 RepID=A0A9W9EXD3_9EURO|nr:uncharacterized protein N7532_008330 [Penicillium argentinense]KAJ5089646.1 hypothetical protein N7532_008330 [Penicillium argentinense]
MIRQFISSVGFSARARCSSASTTLQGQVTRQPTWLQSVRRSLDCRYDPKASSNGGATQKTSPTILPNTHRLFSSTPAVPFASTTQKSSSPFRLSSDKQERPPSFDDVYYSQYQPKRQWPPDMSKLSPKHQFRLERKYRRRAALKYARPKFIKTVTLVQWGVIGFVAIYAVLFMDWDTKDTPFDGIRDSFFSGLRGMFSTPTPPGPVKRSSDENN